MRKMIQVTAENQKNKEEIEQLKSVKQDLTIKNFDFTKKLTDTSSALLKLRQQEFEQAKILAAVKKQLDHKKAECESLTYMIKSNVEQPGLQDGTSAEPKEIQPSSSSASPPKKTIFDYVKSPADDQQDVQLPD